MLNWLGRKQDDIALWVLTLFVGSLLLMLCQTCLAGVHTDVRHAQADESMPCHSGQASEPAAVDKQAGPHDDCLDDCQCGDLKISIKGQEYNTDKQVYANPDKKIQLFAAFAGFGDQPAFLNLLITRINQPDRAIVQPFHRYTVLLN